MISAVIYNPDTGNILNTFNTTSEASIAGYIHDTYQLLVLNEPTPLQDKYVVNGALMLRPENTAELVGTTLTGLPSGTTIVINNVLYPCADSMAELEFDQPGVYHITVQSFPHLDKTFTMEIL